MSNDAMAVPVPGGDLVGLNSPPDSNPALKDGGSDSELSDLEPEADVKPPLTIKPSYYSEGGVPVFKPTMEEFSDFQAYINGANPYGMKTGIVKVIPPAEWIANQPRLDEMVKTVHIKNPIMQDIAGSSGTYRQANMEKGRSYNLPQWRKLCEQLEHQPPADRGQVRGNQVPPLKPAQKPKPSTTKLKVAGAKRGAGRSSKNKSTSNKEDGESTPDRLPTPVSPSMREDEDNDSVKIEPDDEEPASFRRMGGRQPKAVSVSARRKNNMAAAARINEADFENFEYELDEEFSQERCDKLERTYWKTLTYAPPLYGGDMPGTLFTDRTKVWNLSSLPNLLDVLGQKIPGVNTAYLYLGMWKATFAWHLEDVDLYSINYLHFGAPKQWYSISQGDARKFEKAMASIWPIEAKQCDQFLRHKTYLISPSTLLSQYGIKVNKITHFPGEFVITFPYGYHSGYNLGYNCAEAVNFAVDSWLEHARIAKRCSCKDAQDAVWVDYREIERKLRGEDTEFEETDEEDEDEDEEGDNEAETSGLPSPPNSNGDPKLKNPLKKRKRPLSDKDNKANVKKIRVRIKMPSREPCILCPNDIPSETLLSTEDGRRVHRICAQYIPEARIEVVGEKEIVMDIEHIPKARYDLKCNLCRSKKGACFQCSKKKCFRSFHATCGAAAGVFVEEGEVPVFGEDGTEYKKLDFGFRCRFHREKRPKHHEADFLAEDERTLNAALALEIGTTCQFQYHRKEIFAGAIVQNQRSEQTLLVDIVPRGDRVEVEYKWLLLPQASDFHLPKASANATPLPNSFQDRAMLKTTARQVDDLPRAEDPFVEGTTWAEFKCEAIPRNLAQVKVDLEKNNQLWYYLGKTSTEAKAQYTEDPAKPVNNTKAHFLETILRPVANIPRQSYAASYPSTPNQNSLNPPRPVIRLPQQPAYSSSTTKQEKPYQYKPRNPSGETYRVDSQAFRSQHNFVQRAAQVSPSAQPPGSAPYTLKFNTDPKFQPAAHHANAYAGPPMPQAHAMGPLAPPPSYRPPQPPPQFPLFPGVPPHLALAKPPQSLKTKATNPFLKYPYLQIEHNRSPSEYKSPYRIGGGFMNGYQGTKEQMVEAYRKQIFKPSTGRISGASVLPPSKILPAAGGVPTSGVPSATPTPVASSTQRVGPASDSLSTSTPSISHSSSNMWQKKDSTGLHPAIRPEYTMFHNQYQPTQRTSIPQYQSPSTQPPTMYNRQDAQSPYLTSQPALIEQAIQNSSLERSGTSVHAPQHSNNQSSSQQRTQDSPTGTYQFTNTPPCQPHPQYSTTPQLTAFNHQYPQAANMQHSIHAPPAKQEFMPTLPKASAIPPSSAAYGQLAAPQTYNQENKPQYQHQQTTQSWSSEPVCPDVPADSTSIIEKLMFNLRKAGSLQPQPQPQIPRK